MVEYKLRLGEWKCRLVPLPKPQKEKLVRVDRNKVEIVPNKREVYRNVNGEEVQKVLYMSEESQEFVQPFEKTDEVTQNQYVEIPKVKAVDLIEDKSYVVKCAELKQYLKGKDIAIHFLYVASKGYVQRLSVVFYHSGTDKVIMKTSERGFYESVLANIDDSEPAKEIEEAIGRKMNTGLSLATA